MSLWGAVSPCGRAVHNPNSVTSNQGVIMFTYDWGTTVPHATLTSSGSSLNNVYTQVVFTQDGNYVFTVLTAANFLTCFRINYANKNLTPMTLVGKPTGFPGYVSPKMDGTNRIVMGNTIYDYVVDGTTMTFTPCAEQKDIILAPQSSLLYTDSKDLQLCVNELTTLGSVPKILKNTTSQFVLKKSTDTRKPQNFIDLYDIGYAPEAIAKDATGDMVSIARNTALYPNE